jgi:hypothetical protein
MMVKNEIKVVKQIKICKKYAINGTSPCVKMPKSMTMIEILSKNHPLRQFGYGHPIQNFAALEIVQKNNIFSLLYEIMYYTSR